MAATDILGWAIVGIAMGVYLVWSAIRLSQSLQSNSTEPLVELDETEEVFHD
jgi:hypothetical protein